MKRASVKFAEQMKGVVVAVPGGAARSAVILRVIVTIESLASFFDDPDHNCLLEGHVRFSALTRAWLPAKGHVKLFSMGRKPGERIMHYEVEFDHNGTRYDMIGQKYVYDDPGFDAWRDVTTLITTVTRVQPDGSIQPVWNGTLHLSLLQGARLMTTLRGSGDASFLAQVSAVFRFVKFFVRQVLSIFIGKRNDP